MTRKDLKLLVQNHLDELEYTHPFINSDKFLENSFAKFACKKILEEIDIAETLPFDLTPIEILEAFRDKMDRYASMNQKNSISFSIMSDTAQYLIERFWVQTWKHSKRNHF